MRLSVMSFGVKIEYGFRWQTKWTKFANRRGPLSLISKMQTLNERTKIVIPHLGIPLVFAGGSKKLVDPCSTDVILNNNAYVPVV